MTKVSENENTLMCLSLSISQNIPCRIG